VRQVSQLGLFARRGCVQAWAWAALLVPVPVPVLVLGWLVVQPLALASQARWVEQEPKVLSALAVHL